MSLGKGVLCRPANLLGKSMPKTTLCYIKKSMQDILKKFPQKTIAVIGDLILDRYILGDADRISPEAPAPVVAIQNEKTALGGAANAAANVAAMSGKAVLVGGIGNDEAGKNMLQLLRKSGVDASGVFKFNRPTTEKTRVVARSQTIVRLDREDSAYIDKNLENKILGFVASNIKNWDGLIVSDYAKGLITEKLAKGLVGLSRRHRKPIVVDTKPKHFFFFKGATVLTPNKKEAESVAGGMFKSTADLKLAGRKIQKKVAANVLVTLGANGCALFSGNRMSYLPSDASEVFDVTGAGDTLAAAMVLALAAGAKIYQATKLSNAAAGIAVGKTGTATVSLRELKLWSASKKILPNVSMPLPDIVDRYTIAKLKMRS